MLLLKNGNPKKDVYYLGSILIDILSQTKEVQIDFFDVFQKFRKIENISISLYVLTIDWLFILGLVKKGNNNYFEKCF